MFKERSRVFKIRTDLKGLKSTYSHSAKILNQEHGLFLSKITNKANLRDLIAATGLVLLLKIGFKSLIFWPMWPGNLMEDIKNNRAAPLYYVKLCASFQSHPRIQTGVTVRKCSIWVKVGDVLYRVTSTFDRWPWKIIGHIFSATSSFVLHFIAIYLFKMELQSGNAKFGSKSAILLTRVTLKFDGWPWKTIGHLFYAPSSFVYHFIAFCEIKMKLQSGNT